MSSEKNLTDKLTEMMADPSGVENELHALNLRYFHGLDTRNHEMVASAFAVDAFASYLDGDWVLEGRTEIVERLTVVYEFESSVHAIANAGYYKTDDWWRGTLFVTATLLRPGHSHIVLVRGLRYEDDYTKIDGAQYIARRTQTVLWQYTANATPPSLSG